MLRAACDLLQSAGTVTDRAKGTQGRPLREVLLELRFEGEEESVGEERLKGRQTAGSSRQFR